MNLAYHAFVQKLVTAVLKQSVTDTTPSNSVSVGGWNFAIYFSQLSSE